MGQNNFPFKTGVFDFSLSSRSLTFSRSRLPSPPPPASFSFPPKMSSAGGEEDASVMGEESLTRNDDGREREGESLHIREGSDEEFVPVATSGFQKRAKLAELSSVMDRVREKVVATDGARDESEQDADGCPICYEPWTSGGIHRVCSLRCGHLFGKQYASDRSKRY